MNTKLVRVPLPNRGDGYRVIRGMDGKMTTVPLTGADVALYRPMLAMDQAMPAAKGGYGSGDDPSDIDNMDDNPAAPDTEDKVRQLLEGKLDPADLDALCNLIFGDDDAPAPAAQDRGKRGGRQAHDRRPAMPSKATVARLLAEGAARRAERVLKQHASLMDRFPALKNARVGG
jgi:hypothetical protein